MQPSTRIMSVLLLRRRKIRLKKPVSNRERRRLFGKTVYGIIQMTNSIPFSGNPLDRVSTKRGDAAWLAAQMTTGLFLPFWRYRPFVQGDLAGFQPWVENR